MSLIQKKSKPPAFRDNRRSKRRLVHYPAWVQLDTTQRPVECVIKDMSDAGARLSFAWIGSLPELFTLWLDERGKVRRACEIVWWSEHYVGVRFVKL
jgi:hypothetical protein